MSTLEFRQRLESLINELNLENASNTPDFILAKYLISCLEAFNSSCNARDVWYDCEHEPGKTNE